MIVKAETVIAWHRKGFRLFWTWRIHRGKPGRPNVPQEIRDLIRMLSRNNPRWGAPRIHGELLKLGIEITEPTVAKYMVRHRKPPSQTWRTFLENHVKTMVSVDFFTVPTIRFEILYVFLVLAHERRRIVHFAVTLIRPRNATLILQCEIFPPNFCETHQSPVQRFEPNIGGHIKPRWIGCNQRGVVARQYLAGDTNNPVAALFLSPGRLTQVWLHGLQHLHKFVFVCPGE